MSRSVRGYGAAFFAAAGLLVLGSGCATPQMKGTPFYTGEYSQPLGPAEDRVNLWPALYYRDPALSILWPIGEKTEDHFALRPFVSVYGLDQTQRVYSVLWPISEFDFQRDRHRVFPVFWGHESATVFPVYWHRGQPLDGAGYDTLFPFWYYGGRPDGYSAYALGPLVHWSREGDDRWGWHAWPLAGHYQDGADYYRYQAWPLLHQWSGKNGAVAGSAAIPLYWYSRSPGATNLFTPLYASGRGANSTWQLVLPLCYRQTAGQCEMTATLFGGWARSPGSVSWLVAPLLTGGRHEPKASSVWVLGPVAHFGRDASGSTQHVLPLYYRQEGGGQSVFISLPWSAGTNRNGSAWQLVPPVFLRWQDRDGATLVTPLYAQGESRATDSRWSACVPLYFRNSTRDGSTLLTPLYAQGDSRATDSSWSTLVPLYYQVHNTNRTTLITPLYARGESRAEDTNWSALIPIYYQRQDGDARTVATLVGGVHTEPGERSWLIYPLLSWSHKDERGRDLWLAAPLVHAQNWTNGTSQHHVLPLYYWDGRDRTFLSLLAARWRGSEGRETTLVPPALSLGTTEPGATNVWLFGGLAHFGWGERAGSSHVFPVYYRNRDGTLLSPLYASWTQGDSRQRVVPPLLSMGTMEPGATNLWLAGGLAHFGWGERAGSSHVFPVYYRNRDGTLLSPLYATWTEGDARQRVVPPLLSWMTERGQERELYAGLGVFNQNWGAGERQGHLLPLYLYRGHEEFYTPIFGWNRRSSDSFMYPFTPLAGFWGGDHSGGWLFPLFSHKAERSSGDYSGQVLWGGYSHRGDTTKSGLFPIYGYRRMAPPATTAKDDRTCRSTRFWSLPACWYRDETWTGVEAATQGQSPTNCEVRSRSHGFFPLWSHSERYDSLTGSRDTDSSLLLWLYDRQRRIAPQSAAADVRKDYARSRVLWRVWHYERADGDVSVDVFPAITYDSRTNGYRKVSFLWRAFRYERGPEGTQADLLFAPIWRSRPDSHPARP